VQVSRVSALYGRGRAGLGSADPTTSEGKARLRQVARDAQALEREDVLYCRALATILRAGLALAHGRREEAIPLFTQAEALLRQADMQLHAMAARWHRGKLLDGENGQALVLEAEEFARGEKIANPARILQSLVSGKPPIPPIPLSPPS
jgi:hypothetical protein